jgi:hypothetical protein
MRRLMTGHAIYFNKRHKRSGHLFQNRYKSVICEENPYFLELVRYIHLNPMRAGIVKEIQELDKYPWTSHSAILGRRRNPLIPERSDGPARASRSDKPDRVDESGTLLAEKTIEDLLLHFGDSVKAARRRYRKFIVKGVAQGTRPDLQGGGLVRSAGGKVSALSKEDREFSDERILGSGDFVKATLQQSERNLAEKYRPKHPLEELSALAAKRLSLAPERIRSGSRRKEYSQARALFAWLAVEKEGYPAAVVARFLGISRVGVKKAVERMTQSGQLAFAEEWLI